MADLRRELLATISKSRVLTDSVLNAFCSPLFEIAFVLVRFDHLVSLIVNTNHGIATENVSLCAPMKY